MNASHYVAPHQMEPGDVQADQHVLDTMVMNAELDVSLTLTSRLELAISLPFRQTTADAEFLDEDGDSIPGFESIHHRDEVLRGLGDVGLKTRYRLVAPTTERSLFLDLTFGLTLPTGGIEDDPFELGAEGKEHQHVFYGTGTFDPSAAIGIGYHLKAVTLSGNMLWRGALYQNERDYQGPKVLVTRGSAEFSLGENWRARLGAEVYKEWPAKWSGTNARNSGRLDLTPLVGVNWSPLPALNSYLLLKRPFILDVSGGQMEIPFVLGAGLAWSTELWAGQGGH